MIERLSQLNNGINSVREFNQTIRQGMPVAVFGISDAFKDFLVSTAEEKVVYVVKDILGAIRAKDAITELTDKNVVVIPPKDEILMMSRAFSKDSLYERIVATYNARFADVIIATAESLMQTFSLSIKTLDFEKDKEANQKEYIKELVEMGYARVESVESKGCFSVRGDILDVFPINQNQPIRIDFFGDTVESIRAYDLETRKSVCFLDSVSVLQAVESILTPFDVKELFASLDLELKKADKTAKVNLSMLYGNIRLAVENGDYAQLGFISSISKNVGFFVDLIPKDAVIIFDEGKRVFDTASLHSTEFSERFNSMKKEGNAFEISKWQFLSVDDFKENLNRYREVSLQTLSGANGFFNPLKIINPVCGGITNYRLDFKELFTDVKNWVRSDYDVIVCAGDNNKAEKLQLDFYNNGVTAVINASVAHAINILPVKLTQGFIYHEEKLVVIGSGNLFAKPVATRKIKPKKGGFFTAPGVGDYCVHEIHGIGRVLGSKKISSTEGTKDYIAVEYSNGDVLYIPVEQMDILTRYLGGEKSPKLSKIGGKDFERLKKNVKESIKKMSFDLKKLYEERNSQIGFKYRREEELQDLFESAFSFEDTPDQEIATREILDDMASSRVMDRLLCGDVGFGKTEVAFRAAFCAVVNGKQAVMLAPTTILTEQHYNTAVERFKDFGVRVACINRFKTPKQQEEILQKVKDGEVDFVIGTHRLLSKDVVFKDLGLLVLDEEQRFGVEHKEKIKLLRNNVDTLTLSATPIPRTLHMALSGIRSISTLNTPPKKRLPVQTYVAEETDMLVKDAIFREINRGGQVFLLYNRVESIYTYAERLSSILPKTKITVVHGQMDERIMEKNILAFYRGEYDVLVSTTIIENGIDLPKANTLIVIDADRLGLSTLYQLKGRVGRSDRLAYAYFTFKREKVLTQNAYDRLNAIIEFTEMGSGIKIAMRDLEIRGAGNVLGAEQHGHMDKIGYELYSKLLKEELSGKEQTQVELDIRVTAFIPDVYILSNSARMECYKEIAEICSVSDELSVRQTLKEEYGEIPEEIDNLINIASVKYLAMTLGVKEIIVRKSQTTLVFDDLSAFSQKGIKFAMDSLGKSTFISFTNKPSLNFARIKDGNAQMLSVLKDFLQLAVDKN